MSKLNNPESEPIETYQQESLDEETPISDAAGVVDKALKLNYKERSKRKQTASINRETMV